MALNNRQQDIADLVDRLEKDFASFKSTQITGKDNLVVHQHTSTSDPTTFYSGHMNANEVGKFRISLPFTYAKNAFCTIPGSIAGFTPDSGSSYGYWEYLTVDPSTISDPTQMAWIYYFNPDRAGTVWIYPVIDSCALGDIKVAKI